MVQDLWSLVSSECCGAVPAVGGTVPAVGGGVLAAGGGWGFEQ